MSRDASGNFSGAATAAFTILEILVASAILVVIVGMVMGLTAVVLRGWSEGTSTLDRDARLQQAYQLLQYDFESAVLTPDERPWLWFEETAAGGLSLRWLISAADGQGLEMIEWALQPRDALGAAMADEWSLFRATVAAEDWEVTYGQDGSLNSDRPIDAFGAPSDWWQAFVLGQVREWSWEVTVLEPDGTRLALVEEGLLPEGGPAAFPLEATNRRWRAPAQIELRLQVLSADAARQLDRLREELGEGEEIEAFLAGSIRTVAWRFHVGGPR